VDAIKFIAALLLLSTGAWAQVDSEEIPYKPYQIGEVEVDILGSYYEQDGIHSAVEGGEGSQHLTDLLGSIVINVPVGQKHIIGASFSLDAYTSASSSQIDWNDGPAISSASYNDERAYGNLHYSRIYKQGNMLTLGVGLSKEWDVFSHNYTLGWQKASANNNHIFGIDLNFMLDHWKLIYPTDIEDKLIENNTLLDSKLRNTFGATSSYSFVINPKIQAQIVYNYTAQSGLLSTPFHRVYFDTTGTHIPLLEGHPIFGNIKRHPFVNKDIERLPDFKAKHALGLRSSVYLFDWLVMRVFYRYYFDSFGITTHTASVEFPVKPNRFFTVYPFYRYHTQTASTYFKPFLQHNPNEEYYTSDYDLSAFDSHKFGLGVKYSPPFGIYSTRMIPYVNRKGTFKSIELRAARYLRSDELKAFIISTSMSFTF